MADVESDIKDWSTTVGSNKPKDTTTIGSGLADNFQQIQTTVKLALNSKGSDIASATTTDLGATVGLYHDITGTTTITGFGTTAAGGQWKILQFDSALTLTHNATSLILPDGINITTVAGDHCMAQCLDGTNWVVPWYRSSRHSAFSFVFPTDATGDGTTDDTTALQAAIDGLSAGETLVLNGNYKLTGAGLDITSTSRIRITGKGRLFLSSANSDAMIINLNGTCDDVEIDGLTLVGDNNAAHTQHGIGNNSGQTLSRLRIHDLNISNINVGIGLTGVSGTCSNCQVYNNDLSNIRGTSGGQGYGITLDTCPYSSVWSNIIDDADRHAVYIARGSYMKVYSNTILNHRKDVFDASFRAALSIARASYVDAYDNTFVDCYDSQLGVEQVTADTTNCSYIQIYGNKFIGRKNAPSAVYIGEASVPTSYYTTHVDVFDNEFYDDYDLSGTNPALIINNGSNIRVKNNRFTTVDVTTTCRHITLGNLTYIGAAADCTNNEILENTHTFEGGGLADTRAIVVDVDISTTYSPNARIGRGRYTGVSDPIAFDGAWTNTNLIIEDPEGIREGTYADADATPSVKGINSLYITNTGATSITGLDDGEDGQQIMLGFADANTTLDNSYFYLNGTTSWTPTANSRILVEIRGSFAYEIGRSEP